jgi:uncharacterized membrane protein YeaQ/YmgE (transglycosylase-associated protein family)
LELSHYVFVNFGVSIYSEIVKTMSILGFILFLIVAATCAWIAERFVPGSVPGGFFASAIFGIIGAWIGGCLVGHVGPDLAGISLIPCILGSAILVFGVAVLSGAVKKRA